MVKQNSIVRDGFVVALIITFVIAAVYFAAKMKYFSWWTVFPDLLILTVIIIFLWLIKICNNEDKKYEIELGRKLEEVDKHPFGLIVWPFILVLVILLFYMHYEISKLNI